MPALLARRAALIAALAPARHPYFADLRSGRMSPAGFVRGQLQFRFAVEAFTRPMLLLSARLPAGPARAALLDNIADERGADPAGSHAATFRALLRRLDVPAARIDGTIAGPAVRCFNATLLGIAGHEPPVMGLAMLGIIEELFARFSGWIGAAIVANGWLAADAIVHYATHEVLDVEHAEGFFRPIAARWPDPAIEAGLGVGAEAFMALYTALHEEAAR